MSDQAVDAEVVDLCRELIRIDTSNYGDDSGPGERKAAEYTATLLDSTDLVSAYTKNDHLGFQIHYLWGGSRRRYLPDFIVRLANGKNLVLEIKGEDSPMNVAKRDALALWIKAVNAKGGFGAWCMDVAFQPAEIHDVIRRHGAENLVTAAEG